MELFSRKWWRTIECVPGCANCCVKRNLCRFLNKNNECDVHPKKLGITPQEAEKLGRGMGCHYSPIVLFTFNVYCPAIVQIIEKELGIIIPHHTTTEGVEVLTNYKETMKITREIRGYERVTNKLSWENIFCGNIIRNRFTNK
jgi:hypothetical protein